MVAGFDRTVLVEGLRLMTREAFKLSHEQLEQITDEIERLQEVERRLGQGLVVVKVSLLQNEDDPDTVAIELCDEALGDCTKCHGVGSVGDSIKVECHKCHGTGKPPISVNRDELKVKFSQETRHSVSFRT